MGKLGDEIRRLRSQKGWSVRQLAGELGKTGGYISRIEARGEIPTTELMLQIADALDANAEQLLKLAKADEVKEAKSEIEDRYESAILLYRKAQNAN